MSAEPIDEQIATEIVEETLSSIANEAEKQAEELEQELEKELEQELIKAEAEYNDSESDEELDDDLYEIDNETFFDRINAIKYIIAPETRECISKKIDSLKSTTNTLFNKSGNFLWGLSTTALLFGVPLALTILAEQQLIELEKQFTLQGEQNNDLLTALPDEQNQPDAK
ncbi:Mitochondrial import receptor subunit TOM22 [Hanseniaspora opuntiae]|uniref:Mitochondrial import receptor subunit TOM22 n=1 Tax=Hanseniaspora opuntiae TaxID=211096 RepID=A0A1E5RMP6_9ASCO|nr:Mitochondrial import receptor subunit TOM22 [Hanseniaspora opuntiae]